jgi:hypothetical protein
VEGLNEYDDEAERAAILGAVTPEEEASAQRFWDDAQLGAKVRELLAIEGPPEEFMHLRLGDPGGVHVSGLGLVPGAVAATGPGPRGGGGMKKSEMRQILGMFPFQSEALLSAMEEKGQVWDPEEPDLPERLDVSVQNDCAYVEFRDGGEDCYVVSTAPGDWAVPLARRSAILAEAVRRYNLIATLKREMAEYYYPDHPTGSRWLAPLDGKP